MSNGKLFSRTRRVALRSIGLLGGLLAARQLQASHTETHFEDTAEHRIVYQCNKADADYLQHILFSAGELIRKYGDNVEVVIAAFGPGIHLLAEHPQREIPPELQQRAGSLAQYGVAFHAYEGKVEQMGQLHDAFPAKDIFFTEYSTWTTRGIDAILQYFRNWA
jgi:intracellular sulfur oxidation DsrE/DsrF family protein